MIKNSAEKLSGNFDEIASYFEKPGSVLEQLLAAYSEPHQRYHSLGHILKCWNALSSPRA